jgi:hypothetical protein
MLVCQYGPPGNYFGAEKEFVPPVQKSPASCASLQDPKLGGPAFGGASGSGADKKDKKNKKEKKNKKNKKDKKNKKNKKTKKDKKKRGRLLLSALLGP